MKWIPTESSKPSDFSDHTLIVPSCSNSNCDQIAIDILCFTFGKFVGRILSDNLDFVASPDPFDANSNHIASTIDVYECSLPSLGKAILLRVASLLPGQKRKILNYSKELIDFSKLTNIKDILFLRSVPSIFCVDAQIKDWPNPVRAIGPLATKLNIKQLEDYDETQEALSNAVRGELFECLKRASNVPLTAVFIFFRDEDIVGCALQIAKAVCGAEELKLPPSYAKLFGSE
ncbi:proteasome assembly chaperone 2 [Histomonas meleagridis]|uniref:proteasome assembly chaperone 2 n=1 Tax=Histomonas meleagridis TaxID=135588 RepID=UPI0035595CE8|nr:proteasome assembly chaperone 2 [Histomonas meleagridis]KAH0797442.1 proteasome assembly chaperone 2 [Histomonas meleagridis]